MRGEQFHQAEPSRPLAPIPPTPAAGAPGHGRLTIRLFGSAQLTLGSRHLPDFPTQKSRSLFAYLVLHRERLHSREVLVGMLSRDLPEAVARKCFRTELWRVRYVLGKCANTHLVIRGHAVGFDAGSPHWLDVAEFEDRVGRTAGRGCRTPTDAQALMEAVALYRSDALDGVYDQWSVYPRERLKLLYKSALDRLMRYHGARGEWGAAITYGLRVLASDPLLEHVYRDLMRYHCANGDRPAALRVFHDCVRVLREELQVEPMAETRALYDAIRAGGAGAHQDAETFV